MTSLAAAKAWRAANVAQRQNQTGGTESADLRMARLRAEVAKFTEDARAKKRLNDIDEGNVILIDHARTVLAELFLVMKAELEQMPEAMRMKFPGDQRQELVEEVRREVNTTLRRIRDFKWSELTESTTQ